VLLKQPVTAYWASACFGESLYACPPASLTVSVRGAKGPASVLKIVLFAIVSSYGQRRAAVLTVYKKVRVTR
jgi:hypothetical protein